MAEGAYGFYSDSKGKSYVSQCLGEKQGRKFRFEQACLSISSDGVVLLQHTMAIKGVSMTDGEDKLWRILKSRRTDSVAHVDNRAGCAAAASVVGARTLVAAGVFAEAGRNPASTVVDVAPVSGASVANK